MKDKKCTTVIITLFFAVIIAILFQGVCAEVVTDGEEPVIDEADSDASDTAPDYETVFPDDEIREIYITISQDSWEEIQEDMESKYGEFGNRTMTGPGQMGGIRPENFTNVTPGENMMEPPGDGGPGDMMDQEDPIYVPANISFNGENFENVGLRYKGVNSLMTAWQQGIGKISLKIDMDHYEDDYPETENQKFYGFKELNLQSGMSDKSVIREKIVPEIFQAAGIVAPETAFYRVYLDHGDGPEYFGLYTLVESIDDTVIETQFSNGTGNLYKPEGEGATFAEGKLDLEDFEKKTNEDEGDYSDIETLYSVLHADTRNTSPETWRSDLESIFDVEEFLTWLATNTLIKNWDTYGGNSRNYYLYNNPDTGTLSWIPWDNNYALMDGMGGSMGGMGPDGMNRTEGFGMMPPGDMNMTQPRGFGMPEDGGGHGGMGSTVTFSMDTVTDRWPLIRYLMDDPVYHAMYVDILANVAENCFNTTELAEEFDKYHDIIESSVIGPDGEREGYTYLTDDSDFDAAYEELKEHINTQYAEAMEYLQEEETK
ncbi:CotH kinase family protein [Methanospirillum stamsii]|uniref:Spore coat protein n=1 Tax=Methanospirillum stamsii TaxID=1277351 RepID=A0A2V2N6H5_9EURY|nr:CotH kinase family protein [Methanospirillum stamsii]PWR75439.1 spore coat protein [Methanospirillum stamsii]